MAFQENNNYRRPSLIINNLLQFGIFVFALYLSLTVSSIQVINILNIFPSLIFAVMNLKLNFIIYDIPFHKIWVYLPKYRYSLDADDELNWIKENVKPYDYQYSKLSKLSISGIVWFRKKSDELQFKMLWVENDY